VPGESVEELDVSVGVVEAFPVEVADVDDVEESPALDFGGSLFELPGRGQELPGGRPSPISSYTSWISTKRSRHRRGKTWSASQNAKCPPRRSAFHALWYRTAGSTHCHAVAAKTRSNRSSGRITQSSKLPSTTSTSAKSARR
jgi:hypothetical protein